MQEQEAKDGSFEELERAKLVETASVKMGKRSFIYYRLTGKGASLLKEIAKINSAK